MNKFKLKNAIITSLILCIVCIAGCSGNPVNKACDRISDAMQQSLDNMPEGALKDQRAKEMEELIKDCPKELSEKAAKKILASCKDDSDYRSFAECYITILAEEQDK